MKVGMLGCLGLFFGAFVGGIIGVGVGLIWTKVFHTSSFEGYSGMLVFESSMPVGMLLGAFGGAAGLGYLASRDGAP